MDIKDIKTKINEFWSEKTPSVKKAIIMSVAVFLILLGALVFIYNRDEYEFLLSTQDSTVSANVINTLKEKGIKYKVEGNAISVTGTNADELKMTLSGEGVLSPQDTSLELYSKPMFFSENQEKTLAKKDLESNLAKTLKDTESIGGNISNASVILTLGKESAFKNDATPSKAAVKLTLKNTLTAKQIDSIQKFVAASVQNLDASDVVITDQHNNLLSRNVGDEVSLEENNALVKSAEDKLSSQISELLSLGFPDVTFKVVSRVEMNFDQSKIESQEVSSGPDTIVSHQTSSEITRDPAAGGQAGTGSNVPNNGVNTNNNSIVSEKKSETINYEMNKVNTQTIKAPEIKKLSVAVIANRVLTPVEEEKIQDLVSTAALIDTTRGDKVSVQGFDAGTSTNEPETVYMYNQYVEKIIEVLPTLLVIILLFYFGLKILKLFSTKDKEKSESKVDLSMETVDFNEQPSMDDDEDIEIPIKLPEETTQVKKLKTVLSKEMDNNPQKVATVLKNWLRD